eukprot:TRINITY_DN403_c0_g2_i1.p1 TRINITY_DN403_c0_g2~~TRINITY_DN403_c0_g2_i1.p1  ORF type:complete len:390 (-),score=94.40 TRINITY_DN403_c0_g2_i1:34-1203(-)
MEAGLVQRKAQPESTPEIKQHPKPESEIGTKTLNRTPTAAGSVASVLSSDSIAALKGSMGSSLNRSFTTMSPKRKQELVESSVALLQKAKPVVEMAKQASTAAIPYLLIVQEYFFLAWAYVEPYHPEEFAPALLGLFMAFFGSQFFTTFAAVEAYRVCGWQRTVDCLSALYSDFRKVWKANQEDDEEDADGNGISDVLEIPTRELALRKINLVITTVDPLKIADAISGISVGFMGVLASLRTQLAQTITIGVTLGDITREFVEPIAEPVLNSIVPAAYQKWTPVVIIYGSKAVGVSVAWSLHRIISAFYTAIRGAQLFAQGLAHYADRSEAFQIPLEDDSSMFAGIVTGVAAIGFLTQVFYELTLPFPFNIFLWPLSLIEYLLMWIVVA